jgi:hypothetical protein
VYGAEEAVLAFIENDGVVHSYCISFLSFFSCSLLGVYDLRDGYFSCRSGDTEILCVTVCRDMPGCLMRTGMWI